jgi:hypothetical protein
LSIENLSVDRLEPPSKLALLAAENPGKYMSVEELDRPVVFALEAYDELTPVNAEGREAVENKDTPKALLDVIDSEVDTASCEGSNPIPLLSNEASSEHISAEQEYDSVTAEAIPEIQRAESRHLPETGGQWSGQKGDSDWIPNDDQIPKKNNPEGKPWEEIKSDYEFDSIPFVDGEPDFTEVSEAAVEIEDFSTDRSANFTQADEACAEAWTKEIKDGKEWTAAEVKAYRKENNLSWHERSDQKTIDLVPSVVHGNIPHSGGISAAKNEAQ